MKSILLIGLVATSAECWATSLPFYDSLDRMQAVVVSVMESGITSQRVTSIKEIDSLVYQVKASDCVIQVTLEAQVSQEAEKTTYIEKSIESLNCF